MNKRIGIAVVVLVVVLVAVGAWLVFGRSGEESEGLAASGTIEATEADLGFQAGGRIGEILVREGDRVDSGQALARLDVRDLDARRAQVEAQVAAQQARLTEMLRGARPEELAQARAAAAAAEQQRVEAERVARRSKNLFDGDALSQEQLDQAETALDVATQRSRQAADQLELVRQGPRAEQIAAQRAAVRSARASLAQVEVALAYAEVRAPFTGIVTVRHREPGETVGPGLPVVTVMNPDDRWVRIYVREDRIGRVALGQAATIHTDSYADSTFAGRVRYVASQAEFTPRNVQTTEERLKLVYAVKVGITGDAGLALKPGMPADVVLGSATR